MEKSMSFWRSAPWKKEEKSWSVGSGKLGNQDIERLAVNKDKPAYRALESMQKIGFFAVKGVFKLGMYRSQKWQIHHPTLLEFSSEHTMLVVCKPPKTGDRGDKFYRRAHTCGQPVCGQIFCGQPTFAASTGICGQPGTFAGSLEDLRAADICGQPAPDCGRSAETRRETPWVAVRRHSIAFTAAASHHVWPWGCLAEVIALIVDTPPTLMYVLWAEIATAPEPALGSEPGVRAGNFGCGFGSRAQSRSQASQRSEK
ncbi:unnamed protein product [Bursaphelenchus xylophilus]|uniref:(pine wood nematode) hypothetical protein n=1 Tax=Bursaphelenchus xylophilus TaxID=6326 RepID=A0A7I8XPK5_BURXY|nr:unnamed protein product [Bursaphelenchus xylophilus]CAG9088338.1 unnamed protein product [Bursaphelenchus xylophilus]